MASTSEVGHAKNVANFQDLIAFVNGYGANYNPSKTSLQLPQLQTLHTNAKNELTNVTAATTAYFNVVNARVEAFQDLRPLSTRLLNALAATDATSETVKDAEGFNRKIQGKRASKIESTLRSKYARPRNHQHKPTIL